MKFSFVHLDNSGYLYGNKLNQDSVAGSVIQASGMVLFEDGLEAGALGVVIMSAPKVQ